MLPRAAVHYLVTDPAVMYLWHYLKHTHIPDESFWTTAMVRPAGREPRRCWQPASASRPTCAGLTRTWPAQLNSPGLNGTVRPGAFRYIGKRSNHRVVEDGDLPTLAQCQHLFARKFSSADEALRLTNASRAACSAQLPPAKGSTRTHLGLLAMLHHHARPQAG